MTDPIDMSDKPRHTGWGSRTDAESGTDLSPADLLRARHDADPVYKRYKNLADSLEGSGERLDRLFDGDASLDDLLALSQSLIAVYAQMNEIADLAANNYAGPDPGMIVAEVVGMGIDFALELFQPLQDAVGMVLGNPERISVSALMWHETETALATLSDSLSGAAAHTMDIEWQGAARDAALQRLAEFQDAAFTARIVAALLAQALERTAEFAEAVNNRARTFHADTVADVVNLLLSIPGDPRALAGLIGTARNRIIKITLEVVNLGLQTARVYKALSLLTDELAEEFEKTTALLDRLAACR